MNKQVEDIITGYNLIFIENSCIIGKIKTNDGAYYNGLANYMHMMKNHILFFGKNNLVILPIKDGYDRISKKEIVIIDKKNISSINVKNKIFEIIIGIQTDKGCIEYKVLRNIWGAKWHRLNLSYLLLRHSLGSLL